jgi:hypothetical protein
MVSLDAFRTVRYPALLSIDVLGPNTVIAKRALESSALLVEGTLQGFHL